MDLIAWDQNLLLQLNAQHNAFFDGLMCLATTDVWWLALFFVLLFLIY